MGSLFVPCHPCIPRECEHVSWHENVRCTRFPVWTWVPVLPGLMQVEQEEVKSWIVS